MWEWLVASSRCLMCSTQLYPDKIPWIRHPKSSHRLHVIQWKEGSPNYSRLPTSSQNRKPSGLCHVDFSLEGLIKDLPFSFYKLILMELFGFQSSHFLASLLLLLNGSYSWWIAPASSESLLLLELLLPTWISPTYLNRSCLLESLLPT